MSDEKVEVRGIRELSNAFRQVGNVLPHELKVALLGVAENVAVKARGRMKEPAGPAAMSIKPRASTRGASIAFGGTAAPYMPFLDFGGSVGHGHKPGVPWSGAVKRTWMGKPGGDGRYVYPAITAAKPETIEAVDKAIRVTLERAELMTKGHV